MPNKKQEGFFKVLSSFLLRLFTFFHNKIPPFYRMPLLVFAFLLSVFFLLFQFVGQKPYLSSLQIVRDGSSYKVLLRGRFLGPDHFYNDLLFENVPLHRSQIEEWTNRRLVFSLPLSQSVGSVSVKNIFGTSNALLFTNKNYVPTIASALSGALPRIVSLSPAVYKIGDQLTLEGEGFGYQRGDMKITLPSDENDEERREVKDYLFWSDNKIIIRLPDKIKEGNLALSAREISFDTIAFTPDLSMFTKDFSPSRLVVVSQTYRFLARPRQRIKGFQVWLPRPREALDFDSFSVARYGGIVKQTDFPSAFLYALSWKNSLRYDLSLTRTSFVRLRPYTLSIDPSKISPYKKDELTYSLHTTLPSNEIPEKASWDAFLRKHVGRETNPWLVAQALFKAFSSMKESEEELSFEETLKQNKIRTQDKTEFLLRAWKAQGIPSRRVYGMYQPQEDGEAKWASWLQFFIESVGWLPADPLAREGEPFFAKSVGTHVLFSSFEEGEEPSVLDALKQQRWNDLFWGRDRVENKHPTVQYSLEIRESEESPPEKVAED